MTDRESETSLLKPYALKAGQIALTTTRLCAASRDGLSGGSTPEAAPDGVAAGPAPAAAGVGLGGAAAALAADGRERHPRPGAGLAGLLHARLGHVYRCADCR